MKVEVTTPEEFLGDVMGDLNGGAGTFRAWRRAATRRSIRALVPLAEMFGYATDLRSATQGRATYSMEFCTITARPESGGGRDSGQGAGVDAVRDGRPPHEASVQRPASWRDQKWRSRSSSGRSRT